MVEKRQVLVLGAGAGGLIAGNYLAANGYNVTIIEKNDYHLFQPGMLWIAFQGHDAERYMRKVTELVKPNVELVKGVVSDINLEERLVRLSDGREYSYEYLIVALGVAYDYDAVAGHRELLERYGDFFSGVEYAKKLWKSFSSLKEGTFVIGVADPGYKCPPAPHKAAFLAAETLHKRGLIGKVKVVLAVPFVHEYATKNIAEIVAPKLREKGVEVRTMFTVESIDVEKKVLYSLEGEELKFDVATIVPVHRGPTVNVTPENVVDDDGYFKVDKHTLQIEGYDDAYAVGDCNNAPTSKTGVTAHLGGEVVAERIMGYNAIFTGRTNCPLITDGEAIFIISDYEYPPVRIRFSRFKRLLEDMFIAMYWPSLRDPEKWSPLFRAYFEATQPKILAKLGW